MRMHDGALGTLLAGTLRGDETADDLCVRAPALVRGAHLAYLQAGADVIQTNSFLVGLRDARRQRAHLLDAAHACALEAIDEFGSGQLTATIGPHGRDARDFWHELEYWLERGVSHVRIETLVDRAAAQRAVDAWSEVAAGAAATLVLGCTVSPSRGLDSLRWVGELAHDVAAGVDIGLNCCEGPVALRPALELLVEAERGGTWVDPSAGREPYMAPGEWAARVHELIDGLPVAAVGGCCGTTPEHIAALRETHEN